ncbi:fimbria/pilus outer membrane usher protein [Escherichia coli]
MLLGESATSGRFFSSYTFTGGNSLPMIICCQTASADSPNGTRYRNSSAIVTIRQNGYVIYQSYVGAGAFEINHLYPSSTAVI